MVTSHGVIESPLLDNGISALDHGSSTSSLTSMLSTTVVDLSLQLDNTHHMVSLSKVGINKPKVLAVELLDREPCTIDQAFAHKE